MSKSEMLCGSDPVWHDHSAENDLGVNPGAVRCPFEPTVNFYKRTHEGNELCGSDPLVKAETERA